MVDNLRDRIAAAIYKDNGFGWSRYMCEEAADAVIRELGLTRVTRSQNPPIHRYVTEWTHDDSAVNYLR
jgi:hypothetical protein